MQSNKCSRCDFGGNGCAGVNQPVCGALTQFVALEGKNLKIYEFFSPIWG